MGYSNGRIIGIIAGSVAQGRRNNNQITIDQAIASERRKPTVCDHCDKRALYLDWRSGRPSLIGLCGDHRYLFTGGR